LAAFFSVSTVLLLMKLKERKMKHPSSLAGLIRTGFAALAALALVAPVSAQAPPPYDATPELIAAAVKEGKVVFYASTDVLVSEKVASAFQAKYPGIKVQVERASAERIFQRINQEYSRKIYLADVIETSDAVHFTYFKRMNWLQSAVPSEVAKFWPAAEKDVDGQYAVYRAHLSVLAYNTKLVKKEDAPKSHADFLNP
jgi:iron(III) transport system substrate-binding protein